MKTTVKGICLNLNESEYFSEFADFTFYFSSEFYKKKFEEEVKDYVDSETLKLQVKYNVNINFDTLFMLSLYKKIEKRGFRVYDRIHDKEITPSCGLADTIIMY